jgi:hypothetical protein
MLEFAGKCAIVLGGLLVFWEIVAFADRHHKAIDAILEVATVGFFAVLAAGCLWHFVLVPTWAALLAWVAPPALAFRSDDGGKAVFVFGPGDFSAARDSAGKWVVRSVTSRKDIHAHPPPKPSPCLKKPGRTRWLRPGRSGSWTT